MPRPKIYESDAERQRACRDRKRQREAEAARQREEARLWAAQQRQQERENDLSTLEYLLRLGMEQANTSSEDRYRLMQLLTEIPTRRYTW